MGRNIFRWPGRLAAGVFAVLLIGLWVVQVAGMTNVPSWSSDEYWKLALLTLALLSTIICYLLTATSRIPEKSRVIVYGAAMAATLAALQLAIPGQVLRNECPTVAIDRISPVIRRNQVIASDSRMIQAVCWYYKGSDLLLVGEPSELAYGVDYPDSRYRHFSWDAFNAHLRSHPAIETAFFQRTRHHPTYHLKKLSTPSKIGEEGTVSAYIFNPKHAVP